MKPLILLAFISVIFSCNSPDHSECKGDCDDGFGIKTWKDGSYERGCWKDGDLEGQAIQHWGKSMHCYGDIYNGYFVDNNREGPGTYYDIRDDAVLIGDWKHNMFEGYGKAFFGIHFKYHYSYYEGDWLDGAFNGLGKLYIRNNDNATKDKYIGYFVNGQMDGQGTYYWANGDRYSGEFKAGVIYGKGTYIFKNSLIHKRQEIPYLHFISFNMDTIKQTDSLR